jgi:hypothetical protein
MRGGGKMKAFVVRIELLVMISTLVMFLGLLGCGVAITQQTAQQAVTNAQAAVSDAKASRAPLYSADKMKKAERLLKEAEEAVARGRKQRAYTLAMRAEETARAAQQETIAYLEGSVTETREYEQYPARPQAEASHEPPPLASPTPPRSAAQRQEWTMPTDKQASPESLRYEMPPQQVPGSAKPEYTAPVPDKSLSDAQIRIQKAVRTLEEAQMAVNSARAMITKAQVEIGLCLSDSTIQQLRLSGVSADMVNMVNSWYDYAHRAVEAGNYEEASRAIKRAQSYAQSLREPTR